MNDRERWLRTMHYESVDHVPDEEFGYWSETFDVWHEQGMPKSVKNNAQADRFFGFARREVAPVSLGLIPSFRYRILDEDERHKIIQDRAGIKCVIKKDGTSSIPHYLEFPIKDRDSWERFKERLDPDDPRRYPANWEEFKREWGKRDYPLGINAGSLFGWLRNWTGLENISVMFYDDPDLVHDMMEYVTNFIIKVISRAVEEVDFDFAAMWEDMAFNKGPMISPAMFKEFMVPRYKRITDFLRKYGIDVVYVDCDGNINELVGLWLEGGVNCMFPLEINSGSDPYPMREKYGRDLLLLGGVDKKALIAGKDAIKREIKRLERLVADGGFIPHVDHRVPPDVTYENYLYYLEVKRTAFGMPKPEPSLKRVRDWEALRIRPERIKSER
ncbi:MAG: uroporphyrinogen decarboxylase family protein [bacterium]